jgi:catechol 2,3-dioxygenase-like lactoylglutathione lyase family enzyme
MFSGAHAVIYSTDAEADRAFFRDVLGLDNVDAGGGWLIFALPPAEVALHPAEVAAHELFLMCDDIAAAVEKLGAAGVAVTPVSEESWGRLTRFTLPSGASIGLYQPKHPLAHT